MHDWVAIQIERESSNKFKLYAIWLVKGCLVKKIKNKNQK